MVLELHKQGLPKMQDDNTQSAPQPAITVDNVDDEFLKEMGLDGLDEEDKQTALANILFTLNLNVGMRVADQLTEEQLEEFDRLSRPGADEEKLAYWIALNVPNHADLIEEEALKMRDEALNFADDALAAADAAEQPTAEEENQ
jgi:hypothetical protein